MTDWISPKIARVAGGGPARVMDLFAGCGGISLGFHAVGCKILSSVEVDLLSAQTHAQNFDDGHDPAAAQLHAQGRDITRTEPKELLRSQYSDHDPESLIDILVGGPPCQAFARVGRAKLREVAAHPRAFALDDRGDLYLRYLHYVRELHPLAIVMENVPDALNWGGHNIAEEVSEVLDELGFETRYTLLNSAGYGVPQTRERMFLIGYAGS